MIRDSTNSASRDAFLGTNATEDMSLKRARKSFESDFIRKALAQSGGNRTHAARLLEISHRALLYKIKEYEIRD